MRFIDEVEITVEAGHGGSGCKSFRREAGVPMGGPDGGDGGHGGSVIAVADHDVHTLLDFRFQPRWKAEDGEKGRGKNCTGKSGEDLIIKVAIGTELIDMKSGDIIADLTDHGQEFVLAKGGRGGKGNTFFKSATRQVPEIFQPGEPGAQRDVKLSLKLMADVGLIGFPNAGKSTLISRISAARPKIADYPFTTLVPNLGVVQGRGGRSFVVADIPGLIPGASEGKGLGIQFLKHVERTRVLAHLIYPHQLDENGESVDAVTSFNLIQRELKEFSPELAARPQVIILTKSDAHPDSEEYTRSAKYFQELGLKTVIASSVSGEGIQEVIDLLSRFVLE